MGWVASVTKVGALTGPPAPHGTASPKVSPPRAGGAGGSAGAWMDGWMDGWRTQLGPGPGDAAVPPAAPAAPLPGQTVYSKWLLSMLKITC